MHDGLTDLLDYNTHFDWITIITNQEKKLRSLSFVQWFEYCCFDVPGFQQNSLCLHIVGTYHPFRSLHFCQQEEHGGKGRVHLLSGKGGVP